MDCISPAPEPDRLAALRSYGVLDTPPDPAFDRITQLAADLFDAPIALVSLVDDRRQWFKSAVGLEADCTPRSQAFCAQALELCADGVLVVEDALLDPRFAHNPLVVGPPNIRFYAGAVLTDPDGFNLGTLCIIDSKPRPHPSARQLAQLQGLAKMIVDHLANRRIRLQLQEQRSLISAQERDLRTLNQSLEARVRERTAALQRERVRLAASELRLQNLIADAHQAIVVMDEGGRIEGWNRFAEMTFGWRAEEAIGKSVAELLIPAAHRNAHAEGLGRFLATGTGQGIGRRIEVSALRRGGGEIPIELAISASEGPDGWRFTAMMHDISERRTQTELFENAFIHAPIGLALVSLDGRFLKLNDAFAAITRYEAVDLLSATFQEITHPDDLDRDLELLGKLTTGDIPSYQMDKRYVRKDGRVVWVNLSVSMVRRPDGSPKHYIAQVQDLSDRMEAEARYKLMAENATDMIVTSDMHGRTTFVSTGCRAITGWSPTEALGRLTDDFVHPDDRHLVRDAFRRTAAGEVGVRARWRGWQSEMREWVWLESRPSLLQDANEQCFVDVVRDISAQVAQEEALAAAREKAEAAAAAKAEFLANMSHEIRTPLTAVIGFSGLLQDRPDLSPDARLYSDRINIAGRALLSVVNDILDFSKLEAGEVQIRPRPTDAVALARETLSIFRAQTDAKGLHLRFDLQSEGAGLVTIDPQPWRQVLTNLIGNAVKFTETGGVTLSVRHEEDRLHVSVADTGPGLTAEQQALLFQRFSQVDGSTTRKHGGTGLGLAICKGLVEAMGGRIQVASVSGQGSTFSFDIAAPPAASVGEPTPADLTGAIEHVRVLVADDNRANREIARALLEAFGAEVDEAHDGLQAVDAALSMPFDLILMDLRMPNLDGRGALERIRAEPGPNRDIPILCFSAGAEYEVCGTGFNGSVAKPVTPAALLSAISHALHDQIGQLPGAPDVSFG